MGLFDGTPLERPVTEEPQQPRKPQHQNARVRREKRRGKWMTVVTGLDPEATDLKQLAKQLKAKHAAGGSTTADGFELQGDHRDAVVEHLKSLGYPAKPAGG